ncbi:hypothetical protein QQY79_04130 [Flavobacterium tructae]|uniref:hypothetical protein n=1 Tax=Flavobacterium tructae TaxID=1114873 RepID=UPI002551CC73|nr:hypothetical protein [Flavobacterium tructae]MDL2141697.1 hypothetical protein [Flavobacterium tructae]
MWNSFNTYDLSPEEAFETMTNQLFEWHLRNKHTDDLSKFRVINGAGGDGGIEAYGELKDNSIIAVQSKWFRNNLEDSQIGQIEKSVRTAMGLRPGIVEYIISIPRDINSVKIGRGKKAIKNTEETRINKLVDDLMQDYPKLNITWWFEHEIRMEILKPENEGIHKYWFEKELFFFKSLEDRFDMQKTNSWLKERYVPNLNGSGLIQEQISKQLFARNFRNKILSRIAKMQQEFSAVDFLLLQLLNHSKGRIYFKTLNKLDIDLKSLKQILENIMLNVSLAAEVSVKLSEDSYEIYETIDELRLQLRNSTPTNLEKPYYNSFLSKIDILQTDLLQDFFELCNELELEICSIIFGRAGTGKTHGLAYGVDKFLQEGSPALLIRAYGADSSSWTSLLTGELGLQGWNLNEVVSALETLAHRNDTRRAIALNGSSEQDFELSKVLICIDGLEEDMANWDNWYDRINEVSEVTKKFKRVRVLFSARNNFYNSQKITEGNGLSVLELPREGDVAIADVLNIYFTEYNIIIDNIGLISGLDSLFALKLFCEQYKGCTVSDDSTVETATGVLLNLKLGRLNAEFLKIAKKENLNVSPVVDALLVLSEMFYHRSELSHNEIRESIDKELDSYLTKTEAEQLLQFLAENGIITCSEREERSGMIRKRKKYYTITYQSILEIVLSDNITNQIIDQGLSDLPEIIFDNFALPPDMNPIEFRRTHNGKTPNQQLIQNVVNRILIRTGRLIGIDGFLSKGFTEKEIFEMQLEALTAVPFDLAARFKDWVDAIIMNDYHRRFKIIKSLIYPLANRAGHPFNAMYLHNILAGFPNAFARDKFWSGLDDHEKTISGYDQTWSLDSIFNSYLDLSPYDSCDGLPLIYAWSFSTLDQKLREDVRIKLTKWALLAPGEFVKLLDLFFSCNDPQIQEDLSSVVLGFSSRSRDNAAIADLSNWSLKNVFNRKEIYRNVIVRYGFKAVVERAYRLKLISRAELLTSKPSKAKDFKFLPLDLNYCKKPSEEFYPIVHDLAWYVIKDAYDKFLTYEVGYHSSGTTKETRLFLNKYEKKHGGKYEIYPRAWAMAAALKYIRSLGFDRKKGSWFTSASQGSKSAVFTFEEKYVWLAVNYLKGYLSDYLPYNDLGDKFWVQDYSSITEIHNPAEDFNNVLEKQLDEQFSPRPWLIKETLVPEIQSVDNLEASIELAVNTENDISFINWIKFEKADFEFLNDGSKAAVLYNYTGLYNSSKTLQSSIEIHCCTIKKEHFSIFKDALLKSYNKHVLRDDLQYYARPQTDTYANPSDVIWMDWIGEDGSTIDFMDDIVFNATIAKVVKKSVSGEEQVYIPSRHTCKVMKISSMEDGLYSNELVAAIGADYKIKSDEFGESQQILVVDDAVHKAGLSRKGMVRFWFALTIVKKNPHNSDIETIPYFQKVRKYLIWEEDGELKSFKFWDGKFSNQLT